MPEVDLSSFTDEQLDNLRKALAKKNDKKVDFDNMTEIERVRYNATTQPATNKTQHFEYPKVLYGKFADNSMRQAVVGSLEEEVELMEAHPADWKDSLLKHGIETCPSPTTKGVQRIQFLGAPVEAPVEIRADTPHEHPAAAAQRKAKANASTA